MCCRLNLQYLSCCLSVCCSNAFSRTSQSPFHTLVGATTTSNARVSVSFMACEGLLRRECAIEQKLFDFCLCLSFWAALAKHRWIVQWSLFPPWSQQHINTRSLYTCQPFCRISQASLADSPLNVSLAIADSALLLYFRLFLLSVCPFITILFLPCRFYSFHPFSTAYHASS